ncbi:MAG: hypothetical protein K8U57_20440 [Planctomycetes bacterium]|nr:hypothetical protein [Planctomycetota bacterium]
MTIRFVFRFLVTAIILMVVAGCTASTKPDLQPFCCVCFSPDGKLLAAGRGTYLHPMNGPRGTGKGEVFVWSTETWAEPRVLRNDLTSDVRGVAFRDGGREILAASDAYLPDLPGSTPSRDGNRISSWSTEDGKVKDTIVFRDTSEDKFFTGVGFVQQTAHAQKANLLAVAFLGGRPFVVDMNTGKPKYILEGHESSTCLVFSPDEKLLVSCLRRNKNQPLRPIKLFAADSGKAVAELDIGIHASQAAFSPDSTRVVVGSMEGDVVFVTSDFKKASERIRVAEKPIASIAYSPKGDFVAVGTRGWGTTRSRIYLLDTTTEKIIKTLTEEVPSLQALTVSPDGKLLVGAYGTHESANKEKPEGGVKVWETASGKLLRELK